LKLKVEFKIEVKSAKNVNSQIYNHRLSSDDVLLFDKIDSIVVHEQKKITEM
jgi:hypothetical protein